MATEYVTQEQWYATWPPDDTENSIMGSDWHQLTIRNLCLGINEIARDDAGPDRPVPFQAVSQATLLGLKRRGNTGVKAMPDVYIFKKPVDGHRPSFHLRRDGPPAVAIEVGSDSTFEQDIDFEAGKGWIYAAAGIAEYVTIDTSGLLQDPPLQAWRLHDGSYVESALDAEGIWWSAEVPFGIAVRDGMVVVYDRAHRAQLREGEVGAVLARQRASMQRAILQLLRRRFGALPESLIARIDGIEDGAVLDATFSAALEAPDLAELDRHLP